MSNFSGDVIIEVEVEPQDVVAVPPDYNQAKMRVWRYKILGICENGERNSLLVKVEKVEKNEKIQTIEEEKNIKNVKNLAESKIEAKILDIDFTVMTAAKIKEYIKEKYNIELTDDNKNKKAIVKKAYKIVSENKI